MLQNVSRASRLLRNGIKARPILKEGFVILKNIHNKVFLVKNIDETSTCLNSFSDINGSLLHPN